MNSHTYFKVFIRACAGFNESKKMHTIFLPLPLPHKIGIDFRCILQSNQVVVDTCDPDTPGYKLGFRLHDEIISVNGLDGITGKPLLELLLASYRKGVPFSLTLQRHESCQDVINDGTKELAKDGMFSIMFKCDEFTL